MLPHILFQHPGLEFITLEEQKKRIGNRNKKEEGAREEHE